MSSIVRDENDNPQNQFVLSGALSALLFAGSASAEWIQLSRTDNFRIFLEQKQILRNGDLAQIWQLMDFTVAQWADPQTVVWSIKTLAEYDCKEPRFRTLVSEAYSEQMASANWSPGSSRPSRSGNVSRPAARRTRSGRSRAAAR